MKNLDNIKAEGFVLKPTECQEIGQIIERLTEVVKNKKIDENLLHTLINVLLELESLKTNVMWKLIRFAKQNHMLD